MSILTMRFALRISSLLIIVTHTLFRVAVIRANPHHDVPVDAPSLLLRKEKIDPALEIAHTPLEEYGAQIDKEALPLAKVAHRNVMELLHLFLLPKRMHLATYTPLLQQFGVRIHWYKCLKNLWMHPQKSYAGGVDCHFSGPIQLSVDIGYLSDQPKEIVYGNTLHYTSKGMYGLVALLYVMHLHHLSSNAYVGIAYGQSRFDLTIGNDTNGTIIGISNPLVAGWLTLVGGSELKLKWVPQLYGGMQLGVARLVHHKKNDDPRVSNYAIPGYGKIVNKTVFDMTFYLKWCISFLEKKIVI